MSEAILRTAGWKTGLYTSPHLEKVQERIRVSGRDIPSRKFAALITRVHEKEEELYARRQLDRRLTYFEFLTACAFQHFADERVDVAVVEVGFGGRLDATNIVTPQACIITGISLDHQDLLGPHHCEDCRGEGGNHKGEGAGNLRPAGLPKRNGSCARALVVSARR